MDAASEVGRRERIGDWGLRRGVVEVEGPSRRLGRMVVVLIGIAASLSSKAVRDWLLGWYRGIYVLFVHVR